LDRPQPFTRFSVKAAAKILEHKTVYFAAASVVSGLRKAISEKRFMYDAIVIGARCAGSPTAMLLARAGHRVLLLDKSTFPSDKLSTHYIQPEGVKCLEEWGLLDAVIATKY